MHTRDNCPCWTTKRGNVVREGDTVAIKLGRDYMAHGTVVASKRAFCATCERLVPVVDLDGRLYSGTIQKIISVKA